ncbi:MAG: glutathione synthase, partial [Candidatus Binatia bacterium]
ALDLAFVMDPIEKLNPAGDTTLAIIEAAERRGHRCQPFVAGDLRLVGQDLYLRDRPASSFAAVWMRKDPPFDMKYFFASHLLSLIDQRKCFVMNDPKGLREANEKLYALRFPEQIPQTLVSSNMARLKAFMAELGGEMIVKPLDGCGGSGVFYLNAQDRNTNSILEASTDNGRRLVMGQRYLPEIRQGDKRIIVLNGAPLGAVLRVPLQSETRGNIHVGGTCVKTEVTARDQEICAALAPLLGSDGLYLVGLDVIGSFLTEVNVTSPTGIQEVNALDGVCLESQVVDFVERQVEGSLRA